MVKQAENASHDFLIWVMTSHESWPELSVMTQIKKSWPHNIVTNERSPVYFFRFLTVPSFFDGIEWEWE